MAKSVIARHQVVYQSQTTLISADVVSPDSTRSLVSAPVSAIGFDSVCEPLLATVAHPRVQSASIISHSFSEINSNDRQQLGTLFALRNCLCWLHTCTPGGVGATAGSC